MLPNTSISLGGHFVDFVDSQVQEGRYGPANDVMRAGLRLLEEHEAKLGALQSALIAGKKLGVPKPFSCAAFLKRMRAKHAI